MVGPHAGGRSSRRCRASAGCYPDANGYGLGMASGEQRSGFGPALLLGAGLGGFVDGILLHQILRWHHLLSARPDADLTANLVADGLFHAAAWLAVLAGVLWLWRATRNSPQVRLSWATLVGPMLVGWGLFNLVEGVVNHHLLELHHVRLGPNQTSYDVAFLVLGTLLVLVGLGWYRRGGAARRPAAASRLRPGS